MSVGDLVSTATQAGYAVAGLGIAIVGFAIVLVATFRRRHDDTFERARRMPLDDETPRNGRQDEPAAAPRGSDR
jgi:hypothetical protein